MPVTPKQIACTEKKKIAETSQKMKEKVKPEHVSLYRQTLLWVREKSLTGAGSSETTAFATDPRKHCREMKWVIGKLVEKFIIPARLLKAFCKLLYATHFQQMHIESMWAQNSSVRVQWVFSQFTAFALLSYYTSADLCLSAHRDLPLLHVHPRLSQGGHTQRPWQASE